MRTLLKTALAGLAIVATAGPALATPMATADLNTISSPSIGSGILGVVTLTQDGATRVDVQVALAAGTDFVNSGGPHTPFAFNLDLLPVVVAIISPTGGIFVPDASGGSNTPYGSFNFAIDYTGGSGGGHGNPGPLEFSVTRLGGISIADFVSNAAGYIFSADVIGPAGSTGSIAASHLATVNVPEPAPLAVLGVGLLGLGLIRHGRGTAKPHTMVPARIAA